MQPYANLSGNTGVDSFDIIDDGIKVKFKYSHKIYTYTSDLNGEQTIKTMADLAIAGKGLSGFIGKNKESLKFMER